MFRTIAVAIIAMVIFGAIFSFIRVKVILPKHVPQVAYVDFRPIIHNEVLARLEDSKIAYVVIIDGHWFSASPRRVKEQTELSFTCDDGRALRVVSQDDGKVIIGEEVFDLAAGNLFTVRVVPGGGNVCRQFEAHCGLEMTPDIGQRIRDFIVQYAATNPELERFTTIHTGPRS